MTAACIVIAPSVRTQFKPVRRTRGFVAFEADASEPGNFRTWQFVAGSFTPTRDVAVSQYLDAGRRVFLSPKLPGDEKHLPVKEITR